MIDVVGGFGLAPSEAVSHVGLLDGDAVDAGALAEAQASAVMAAEPSTHDAFGIFALNI